MPDDTEHPPHTCDECGETHDSPEMEAVRQATLDAFFNAVLEHGLEPVDQTLVASSIAACMADSIFQGLVPDAPLKNRAEREKMEFLATYVTYVGDDLAELLDLPADLCVDDDEEINDDTDLMPGMSKFH